MINFIGAPQIIGSTPTFATFAGPTDSAGVFEYPGNDMVMADLLSAPYQYGVLDPDHYNPQGLSNKDFFFSNKLVPNDAVAAIYRIDGNPRGDDYSYFDVENQVDYDMVLFINLSETEELVRPRLGISLDANQTGLFSSQLNVNDFWDDEGGFNGSGIQSLSSLKPGQVWATLIPADDDVSINAFVDGAFIDQGIKKANIQDGEFAFIRTKSQGALTADLKGLEDVVLSPDGNHLYAISPDDDALVVVNADDLSQRQFFRDGVNGFNGLSAASEVALSDDGEFVYVVSKDDYMVSVFDRDTSTGNLSFVETVSIPSGQVEALTVVGDRLYVTGDTTPSVRITNNGLTASLYQSDNELSSLSDIEDLVPIATEQVNLIQHNSADIDGAFVDLFETVSTTPTDNFGIVWEGEIDVVNPLDNGTVDVEFFLSSNDGSRLYIDDTLVIDNDGVHNLIETSSSISLAAGTHTIRVEYFENTGDAGISLDYKIGNGLQVPLTDTPIDTESIGILAFNRDSVTGELTGLTHTYSSAALSQVRDLVSSQDGSLLYVTSSQNDSLTILDASDLTELQVLSGIGLNNVGAIAVSNDDQYVYVAGEDTGILAIFERNNNGLSATPIQLLQNGVNGLRGLGQISDLTVAQNDEGQEYLYVTSQTNNSLAVFVRDSVTGELSQAQVLQNLTGLSNSSAVVANGDTVYVASSGGFGLEQNVGSLASFTVNTGNAVEQNNITVSFSNIDTLNLETGLQSDLISQIEAPTVNTLNIDSSSVAGQEQADIIELAEISGQVNLSTSADNDQITIGNGTNVTLTLNSNSGADNISLTNIEGTTTINGAESANDITLDNMGGTVSVNTGSDADQVTLVNSQLDQLTIATNGGADSVELVNVTITGNNDTLTTGNDNDTVSLADVQGLETVNTGESQDSVTLIGVNGSTVNTGGDADQVNIQTGINGENDLIVNTQAGEDEILVASAGLNDAIIVNAGIDNDTIQVNGQQINADVTVNGEDGTDTLNFNVGTGSYTAYDADGNPLAENTPPVTPDGGIEVSGFGRVNYTSIEGVPDFTATTATMNPSYTINEGSSVTFEGLAIPATVNGSTPITIASAQWLITGNNVSATIPLNVTPNNDGTVDFSIPLSWSNLVSLGLADDGVYILRLDVTDSTGTTVSTNGIFTITNVNPSDVTITTIGNLTEGSTIQFTGSFSDAGSNDTHSYTWDFGDGTVVNSDSPEISHTYIDNGNYTVTLTVKDDDGGMSSNSIDLTIGNVAPTIDQVIISNLTPEQGEEVTLSVNATDAGANDSLTYSWNFGDGSTATGQEVTYTYNQEGTFTVEVTVTDSDGDSSLTYTQDLTVVNVAPTLTEVTIPTTGEEGEELTFSATATDINNTDLTYSWDFGDGNTATGATVTHTYSQDSLNQVDGVYFVILSVTDNQGKTTVTTENIEISNANPTITEILIPNSAIKGESVSFSATATDVDADNLTYTWNFGDGNTATGATVTHTYNDLDLYFVTLTVEDEDGGIISNKESILITNLAPTINSDNNSITVNEGETAENTGNFSDSANDIVTLSANIGSVIDNGDGTWTWNYTTEGTTQTQQIIITATDSEGETAQFNFDLIVNNLNPTLNVDNSLLTIDEGQNVTNTGSFGDAADDVALTASVGTVIDNGDGSWTWDYGSTGTLTYEDGNLSGDYDLIDGVDDSQTVTITATDSDGAETTVSFDLVVNNVAPTITADNSTITVDEGETAFNTGSFGNDAIVSETTVQGDILSEPVSISNQGDISILTIVDVVELSASVGEVTDNGDGTWSWSYTVADEYLSLNPDQIVIITAIDSNEDSEEIASFTLSELISEISLTTSGGEVIDNGDFTWSWTYDAPVDFDENTIVTIRKNGSEIANFTLGEVINPVVAVDEVTLTASIGEVSDNGDGTWTWFYDTINGPDENQTFTITATDSDGLAQDITFDLVVNPVASQVLVNKSIVSVNEGNLATNSGTFEDLNADSIVDVVASVGTIIDNGDGTWNWSYDTVGVANETQTVTITATDNDALISSNTFELTINNVAPEIAVTNFYVPINEGEIATNEITVTDPGNDAVTVELDPNSLGTINQNPDGSWTWSYEASDDFDDNQTVTIIATDSEGAETTVSFDLVVNNVAPTTSVTGADTVDEGSEYTLTLNEILDPGTDTANYLVSWGDGSEIETYTSAGDITHTYADSGDYTIQVSLVDEDGTYTNVTSKSVTVNNVAPVAVADSNNTTENNSVTTDVIANDTDVGATDVLSLVANSATITSMTLDSDNSDITVNTASVSQNGNEITFNPGSDFDFLATGETATVVINYTVTDDDGTPLTDEGTLTITVTGTNDAPVAIADSDNTTENASVTTDVIANDTDVDATDVLSLVPNSVSITSMTLDSDDSAITVDTASVSQNGNEITFNPGSDFDFLATGETATVVINYTVTDDDGTPLTDEGTVTITVTGTNDAAIVTANPTQQTVDYSDSIQSVTFTATDVDTGAVLNAAISYSTDGGVTFTPGLPDAVTLEPNIGLVFEGDSNQASGATWTLSGIADLAPASYLFRATITDDFGATSYVDTSVTVEKEDAIATYTGLSYVSTAPQDPDTALVPLEVTIQDLTAFDSALDSEAGNISQATVTFFNQDTGEIIAEDVPVTLFSSDSTVGIASANLLVTLTNSEVSRSITIGYEVGYPGNDTTSDGFYTSKGELDVITVVRPDGDFIAGGGFLINESSAGVYGGETGLKTQFGFNVKFNKQLTNLQGKFKAIIRPDSETTLEIQSNATDSLVVNPIGDGDGLAEFISKANLVDISDPDNPVPLQGNLTLTVTMTDNGEPGDNDTIGFTLRDANGTLLYSSYFDGVQTLEQTIAGGNLDVKSKL